jgi:hypothetical protein
MLSLVVVLCLPVVLLRDRELGSKTGIAQHIRCYNVWFKQGRLSVVALRHAILLLCRICICCCNEIQSLRDD